MNPYKAPIALLCEVYRFCCCCPTYIFSVDLPMLVEDIGKFQKHCCLRASRMDCNVCFIVKLQLVKEVYRQTSTCQRSLEPLIFANEFYHYRYTTLLAYHRPKLEKM